jgi:hypothetical protein
MAEETISTTGEASGSAQRGNGYDGAMVRSFLDRIEHVQADIDEVMDAAQLACAPHREDIAAIKKEATDAGIPRRAMNALISERRMRARADQIRDSLTADDQDRFDNLKAALGDFGDTALGAAALKDAEPSRAAA